MGIPGLARRLEPYSNQYSAQDLEGYTAIIDGPSLAYEAQKLALSTATNQSRLPSYADINNEAIRWLKSLEEQGIRVSDVLFDGALPVPKQTERLSRMDQNNRRVQQLRASYAATACPIPTYLGSTSYAFLAPSLREALAQSPFASKTRIVPGEADDFCGLRAKDTTRSIIFTSDTDLLLFDYHPETLIVLFQDADSLVGYKAYSPQHIAQKLQLKSLVPFAWVIQQRTSEGQNSLVRDARRVDMNSSLYLKFSQRYTVAVTAPTYREKFPDLILLLQDLDVRVSEFVHHVLIGSLYIPVYLPLLVEDPNQASAWNMAQDVRTFAYSLLAPPCSTLQEYRRKAQGISPQEISIYAVTGIEVPAKELADRMSALLNWAEFKDLDPTLLWSLFALSLVVAQLNTPPPTPLLLRVLCSDFDNTWVYIQLAARIQAAMYSLRLLKQITSIWLAIDRTDSPKLHENLLKLNRHMSTLPSIPGMFLVPGQARKVLAEHDIMKDFIKEIYASVGVEAPTEHISNKKRKKQAREAERNQKKVEQRREVEVEGKGSVVVSENRIL